MNTEAFKSHDFALRAQKKILGQISSRKAAKVFISDNLYRILDLLYQLIKSHVSTDFRLCTQMKAIYQPVYISNKILIFWLTDS